MKKRGLARRIVAGAIIWTVIAAASTLYYGINLFRRDGVSSYDIDVETTPADATAEPDFDEKLRKLAQLYLHERALHGLLKKPGRLVGARALWRGLGAPGQKD